MPYKDPEAQRTALRKSYERNKDRRIAEQKDYRHRSPEHRSRWNQWKRTYRHKHGARSKAAMKIARFYREHLAASVRYCKAVTASAGRMPWNGRMLNDAQKYRIRYRLDENFRAREIFRIQTLKVARAKRIAATCDGSITPEFIRVLFAEAHICPYCLNWMDWFDKSMDHVEPLIAGGAHSVDNVIVCCKTCNTRKGRRRLLSWIAMGPPDGVHRAGN